MARWTWNKLGSAERLGVAYNEETVTENLLLKIAQRHRWQGLEVRSWTKIEEGKGTSKTYGKATGADWDFWISDWAGRGVQVRVQAKRQFSSGKYDSLNGGSKQFSDLWNNRGSAIPIYLFYNWHATFGNRSRICAPSDQAHWGCSFAPHPAIPKIKAPSPADIKVMRPWHCLFCQCGSSSSKISTLPDYVGRALKSAYMDRRVDASEGALALNFEHFEPKRSPPDWMPLTERGSEGVERLQAYLKKHQLRGVASVKQTQPILEG